MPIKKDKPGQPPAGPGAWLRKHWVAAGVVLTLLLSSAVWYGFPQESLTEVAGKRSACNSGGNGFLQMPGRADNEGARTQLALLEEKLRVLNCQLELADHTLCSYREGKNIREVRALLQNIPIKSTQIGRLPNNMPCARKRAV